MVGMGVRLSTANDTPAPSWYILISDDDFGVGHRESENRIDIWGRTPLQELRPPHFRQINNLPSRFCRL
jgi:hypothetical protein